MPKHRVGIVLCAALLILTGCGQAESGGPGGGATVTATQGATVTVAPPSSTPVRTASAAAPIVRSPTTNAFCPVPTPESRAVRPLISPTDSLTQTITLVSSNMARIEVDTESGHFAADGASVAITLLPNTVHHLTVRGTVKVFPQANGCTPLGGYTLETTTDQQGRPLTIVQGSGTGTRTPVGTPSR